MTLWSALRSMFRSGMFRVTGVASSKGSSARWIIGAISLGLALGASRPAYAQKKEQDRPNILFVIMDDVGIDQMAIFGYGGPNAPKTPNIDAIAGQGVRFRNMWGMPECSPSRAALMTGRYPLRTNIYQAIGPKDLANSQVSPYETTAPRLLKRKGYTSGLFGKFHLGGPENNPFGNGTPNSLGFDFFYGYTGGLPDSIDTTAGGVAPKGTYSCGYVDNATSGACYFPESRCADTTGGTIGGSIPGLACLEQGGIFVPSASCKGGSSPSLDFNLGNAYYVSPVVVNRRNGAVEQLPLSDPRSREYRTTLEVNAARDWIKRRPADRPWMATVSFSSDHTPLQPPPEQLQSASSGVAGAPMNCAQTVSQRALSNQMIEALDAELGRLLVQIGIAKRDDSGALVYNPKKSDTMIIIAGDNGSFGVTVKPPFDPSRAKGTSYQTGVWVPLIVAGPLVRKPGRDVEHMVNAVDVFQLFGEIAGIDARRAVPRAIDSSPLLPYLRNPDQSPIRRTNFAQFKQNIQIDPNGNGPCVLGTSCSQTPISKSVCEDNGGVWWGEGADDPTTTGIPAGGLKNCCEVNQFKSKNGQSVVFVLPGTEAMRDEQYKLVRSSALDYDAATDACVTKTTEEFFEINQAAPIPKLDTASSALPFDSLTSAQRQAYESLEAELDALLASQPPCPGDGNLDGVVNRKDLEGYRFMLRKSRRNLDGDSQRNSTVFDFNFDGLTDEADRQIIKDNLGRRCG